MCGIALLVGSVDGIETSRRMVAHLAHRGPDGLGYRQLDNCAFGHARLSIIDLATGDQPMADASGRYWITFNGEIYNYGELRSALAHGHEFRTQSDTEIILAAYATWGTACLDRFRGMFAFAIWDRVEKTLFVARDLFGEKPLYYARGDNGSLAAASEIGAVLAAGMVQARLSLEAVDAFLAFGYVPPDRTIFADIAVLPPAHYLVWKAGRIETVRYWKPRLESQRITMDAAAGRLRELIEQAVRRQMVADVPVGAFLSGGLDSSTIVAMMQQHSSIPVQTFSVGFGDVINELPYARAVARRYGTEHHEIDLGRPDVAPLLERMADVYGEPFADTSHIPMYLISQFARRHVKVVLSGDGGDELLGGYWWHSVLAEAGRVGGSFASWAVLRIASTLIGNRNRALKARSVATGYAARWPDPWLGDIHSHVVIDANQRRKLWGRDVTAYFPGDDYRPDADVRGLNRGFFFDIMHYLPGDILVKVDRAAMAHGLETRAPFLDRDLAEFALSLPSALKVDGHRGKLVLREACQRDWPEELHGRGKQGFGSPVAAWLGLPDVAALVQRVTGPESRLRDLLRGRVAAAAAGRDYRAWILMTLGLWLERNREATW